MSTLAVLRLAPDADAGRVASLLDSEVRTLWRLYTEGVVTHVHLTNDPTTVVLVFDTQRPDARRGSRSRAPR